jgi:hypothetical protein
MIHQAQGNDCKSFINLKYIDISNVHIGFRNAFLVAELALHD